MFGEGRSSVPPSERRWVLGLMRRAVGVITDDTSVDADGVLTGTGAVRTGKLLKQAIEPVA